MDAIFLLLAQAFFELEQTSSVLLATSSGQYLRRVSISFAVLKFLIDEWKRWKEYKILNLLYGTETELKSLLEFHKILAMCQKPVVYDID